ncbi:MAG: DUF1801 domain-containing protein [Myxococcaceae bacterium]|nr:DUF1801 domain-containing protein [Myxococcaceae bacterium]
MAKTDFKSIDAYLKTQPKASQAILKQVRGLIRKAVPKADEVISYQIPAFKLNGRAMIYFAGWKEHYSLYPATEKVQTTFKKELAPYEVSKGTIRFPLTERVPARLITRIAQLRAQETLERLADKKAAAKKK